MQIPSVLQRAVALALVLLLPRFTSAQSEETPRILAFRDVAVLSMEAGEDLLQHQTVLIHDGRIAAVGPVGEVDVPESAFQIEGAGNVLIPGLVEMHGHLPGPQWPAEWHEHILFLYLANGVTTVRGMLGDPSQLELRDAIERGEVFGPRIFVGSPPLGGFSVHSVEQATSLVPQLADAGYDHLKVHEGLAPEVFSAIARTARDRGLQFGGHVSDAVGLASALEAGQYTIDHLDNFVEALVPAEVQAEHGIPLSSKVMAEEADEALIASVVNATKQSGAAVVPTMALWESIYGEHTSAELRDAVPELRYMPHKLVDQWASAVDGMAAGRSPGAGPRVLELRRKVLAALARADVPILLGTDSPQLFSVPGFSIHREVAAMAAAGMRSDDILAAATRAAAEHCGRADEEGTIAVGKRADLVLLRADPRVDLASLREPVGVLAAGRWIAAAEIRERLDAIARAAAE